MADKGSKDDSTLCQICNNDNAEMFCAFCESKLCKICVGSHIAEDPQKHKIVKHQDRKRTVVLPKCANHLNERCENFCQECDTPVCSSCVSSDSHERHKFLNILDIFKKKKEIISNDTDELEQIIMPSYEGIIKQVETEEKKVEKEFETLLDNMEKRRKVWHQEIDDIVDAMKKNVCDMRMKQITAQKEHLQTLKKLLSEVQESILLNRNIFESPNVSNSLTYTNKNPSLKQFPSKLELSVPCFQPQAIKREMLQQMFGIITGFSISNKEGGYKLKPRTNAISTN